MDNTLFYNSFYFTTYSASCKKVTDHSHGIKCHYLARVIHGRVRFVAEDKSEMWVEKGEVFYLPLGLKYRSYWFVDDSGQIKWESYKFGAFPINTEKEYFMQKIKTTDKEDKVLDELSKEMKVNCKTIALLYSFFATALDRMKDCVAKKEGNTLDKIWCYAKENPDFSVSALAKHCDMSESGLYAFMRRSMNTTPVELRNKMKMERAIFLLQTTRLSIEEITEKMGFGTSGYFRKVFRKYCGKTPMQVRKETELL